MMSGLVFILIAAFALVAVFDLLAQAFGVDSRPEFEDPRAPAPGLYT
jgi:hypothetical protein